MPCKASVTHIEWDSWKRNRFSYQFRPVCRRKNGQIFPKNRPTVFSVRWNPQVSFIISHKVKQKTFYIVQLNVQHTEMNVLKEAIKKKCKRIIRIKKNTNECKENADAERRPTFDWTSVISCYFNLMKYILIITIRKDSTAEVSLHRPTMNMAHQRCQNTIKRSA